MLRYRADDPYSSDVIDESTLPAPVEIGDGVSDGVEMGGADGFADGDEVGADGYAGGVEVGEAVRRVIKQARDNRQPAPKMRAVDVDAPTREPEEEFPWALEDVYMGAADPFPLLAKLLQRAGAGMPPRFVRVDTEESYKQFRSENSPELAELMRRTDELAQRLSAHEADPGAHDRLAEDVEDLTLLGAEVQAAEADKRVDVRLPKHFEGKYHAWREGDFVFASIALPGPDGNVRIATSPEPVRRAVSEMARHASEANVPAGAVVDLIPGMGVVLGAGTAIKEMAAAAPAILRRKEAQGCAPFVVRVEPKAAPALCALAALLCLASRGDAQAKDEWTRLSAQAGDTLRQAMGEAERVAKAAR